MNLKFLLARVHFVEVTLRYFLTMIFLIIILTFYFMSKVLMTRNYDVLGLC